MATSNAVLASSVTMSVLGNFFNKDTALFRLAIDFVLPMRFVWATIIVGAIAGIVAIFFTKLYSLFDKMINKAMKNVPLFVKVVSIFLIVAVLGAVLPCFHLWASLIPLLFPRIAIALRPLFDKK